MRVNPDRHPEGEAVIHWTQRNVTVHLPPELMPAFEEALKLPVFKGKNGKGVKNVLVNFALRRYLRQLYRAGHITNLVK